MSRRTESAPAKAPTNQTQVRSTWRYTPHLLIFFSSACVMVVELVAGRLTGRHLGTSLYTWTSIIGVVLAGMSLGNYIGGRMADRRPAHRLLGWLFLIASGTCVLSLLLNRVVADWPVAKDVFATFEMEYPARVFVSMVVIFLAPALALGTISPVVAKMALDRGTAVGQTIGSVYAWGAVGSIVGTFLAGFWLIAALGSTGVVLTVAAALSLIGLVLGPGRIVHAAWLAVLGVLLFLSQARSPLWFGYACAAGLQDGALVDGASGRRYEPHEFCRDSNYQFVRVSKAAGRNSGRTGRELTLDSDRHSFVDLTSPDHLEYDYTRIYGDLTLRLFAEKKPISAFFVGGGGYTFPRWIQHRFPGSHCDVAEIDPVVVEACHRALGLPRHTSIRTFVGDARMVVERLPREARYDLIIGDAFNNELTIPWHLATLEFHRRLKSLLTPDGAMLTNIIDDFEAGGRLVGAYIQTVQRVFKHVYVFCTERTGPGAGRDNFIVAAFDRDRPGLHEHFQTFLPPHWEDFSGSLLSPRERNILAERCGGRVLTDDNAPVENLVAARAR